MTYWHIIMLSLAPERTSAPAPVVVCIAKCECLIVEGDREAGGEGETTRQGLLVQTTNHRQLESGHGGGEEAVPGHRLRSRGTDHEVLSGK